MSVEGLCEICQSATIDHGCDRCGQLVCSDHYDSATGVCTECRSEVGPRPVDDERPDRDRPDGVDEHRF